jgi:hypothetical protein
MITLLVLVPAAIYLAYRSKLACLLRSLPSKNSDFIFM